MKRERKEAEEGADAAGELIRKPANHRGLWSSSIRHLPGKALAVNSVARGKPADAARSHRVILRRPLPPARKPGRAQAAPQRRVAVAVSADGSEAQLSAEDVISWLKRAKKRVRGKWAKTALRSCAAAFKEAYTAHQAQSQGERSTLDDAAAAIEQKEVRRDSAVHFIARTVSCRKTGLIVCCLCTATRAASPNVGRRCAGGIEAQEKGQEGQGPARRHGA